MMATPIRCIGLYTIAALKQAGYNAGWLKTKFKWSGEEEHQVTQPKILARHQALALASSERQIPDLAKLFFVCRSKLICILYI
jgi:hypothetical protein